MLGLAGGAGDVRAVLRVCAVGAAAVAVHGAAGRALVGADRHRGDADAAGLGMVGAAGWRGGRDGGGGWLGVPAGLDGRAAACRSSDVEQGGSVRCAAFADGGVDSGDQQLGSVFDRLVYG